MHGKDGLLSDFDSLPNAMTVSEDWLVKKLILIKFLIFTRISYFLWSRCIPIIFDENCQNSYFRFCNPEFLPPLELVNYQDCITNGPVSYMSSFYIIYNKWNILYAIGQINKRSLLNLAWRLKYHISISC